MTIYPRSIRDLTTNLARALIRTLTKPWTPRRDVLVCPTCKETHR